MNKAPFSAADAALGYLYQVRVALLWALRRLKSVPDFAVSLETLDDVVFETKGGAPQELLQTKHHRSREASLTARYNLGLVRGDGAIVKKPHVPRSQNRRAGTNMKLKLLKRGLSVLTASAALLCAVVPAHAEDKKPNILFIMGDDIGWMQPSCYHRGLMVGETPNIDRLAKEGAMFMHYYAESSCTAGRTAFFTGMHPYRAGMVLPQLPGAISYLRPGTPALARFLLDQGYNTGQFGKNHLGDHPDSLPTAHGFQEFWGYLYHLDAMQQVSFPDINSDPNTQAVVPPMKMIPIPGIPPRPGEIDPKDGVCMAAPRPVLWMKSPDGTAKNQTGKDEGPITLERSKTIEDEISAHTVDWLDRNDPKKTGKPFFCWMNQARMHVTTVLPQKYLDMIGTKGGKDWGANEAGMKQMDDNIGVVLKKLEDMGELDNTIIVWTTDNGAEVQTFPDGGVTPFKAGKLSTWEGGMRVPCVIRWPGVIKPGTIFNQMFSSLDWLPTFVEIAGGPKGEELNTQIMAGKYRWVSR